MKQPSWPQKLNARLGTVLLVGVLTLAAALRLYQLASLPPALHPSEAQWARLALEVTQGHHYGLLTQGSNIGYGAYIAVEAAILTVAKSILALRYYNAVIGIATVLGLYLFAKDWFGRRAALLGAFFMAVSPWAVTFSRNNWPVNLSLFCLVWALFLTGRAYRSKHIGYSLAAAFVLALGCYSSRFFWAVPIIIAVMAIVVTLRSRDKNKQQPIRWLIAGTVGLALLAPIVVLPLLKNSSPIQGLVAQVGSSAKLVLENCSKTALMFFARGDEDYTRNLGGLPMLSAFVGLMFLLGMLVAISRAGRAKYLLLLVGLILTLVPAILLGGSTVPDAYRAVLALPFVCLLAGIGTNYLLACWYGIFPINTTARTIGLSFVVLLMMLSAYQAYRQYFVAWAQDPKTYAAYREDLTQTGVFIGAHGGVSKSYVVADNFALGAAAVSLRQHKPAKLGGSIEQLESLPLSKKPNYVLLPLGGNSDGSEQVRKRVQAKFPGGKFEDQRSSFDDRVLFVWYRLP